MLVVGDHRDRDLEHVYSPQKNVIHPVEGSIDIVEPGPTANPDCRFSAECATEFLCAAKLLLYYYGSRTKSAAVVKQVPQIP